MGLIASFSSHLTVTYFKPIFGLYMTLAVEWEFSNNSKVTKFAIELPAKNMETV